MTRVAACAALLAAIAQQPAPVAPSRTLDVHGWVEDANGLPASGMSAADFELQVDGTHVAIQQLLPRRNGTSIVILIDTSRSVGWITKLLERNLDEFVGMLGPADRSTIATFGGRASLPPLESGARDVRDRIHKAMELRGDDGYGSSPVWDAIHEAVTLLSREPPPRAILLLTDGRATGNRYGLSDVADYAMAHGVCISAVLKNASQWISQGEGIAALVQPGVPIQGLTTYTGGMFFTYPEKQEELARAVFKRVATTLTATHVFSFVPPRFDGLPHRLVIRPTRRYVNVHAPLAFVAQ